MGWILPPPWTPEEWEEACRAARNAFIQRHVNGGWKYAEGVLKKDRVEVRVRGRFFLPHMPIPGQVGYDPRKHAPAVFMGAVLIPALSVRRSIYQFASGLYCNANGELLVEGECPECGSVNGEFRLRVKVRAPNPYAKPWENAWTYCRRCCSDAEVMALRNQG